MGFGDYSRDPRPHTPSGSQGCLGFREVSTLNPAPAIILVLSLHGFLVHPYVPTIYPSITPVYLPQPYDAWFFFIGHRRYVKDGHWICDAGFFDWKTITHSPQTITTTYTPKIGKQEHTHQLSIDQLPRP